MAAAEETVSIRGKPLTVREGDLILLSDNDLLSKVLNFFNSGYSHVVTVVRYEGRLVAFSVYIPPDGLVLENIERFASHYYTKMAIVRPQPPRTAEQTTRLRLAVADVLRKHRDNPRDAYDPGLTECFHALFRMKPATENKYICSELAARLAQAAGAWPAHRSVSVKIDDLARVVGTIETVF